MQEFQWKMESFAKNADVNNVIEELQSVKNIFGKLDPKNIVAFAEDSSKELHGLFEWDNNKAANKYREQQARNILNNIEVKVVSNGNKEVNIPYFEIVSNKQNREYKEIDTLTYDEKEEVRLKTIDSLEQLQKKLERYDNFNETLSFIDSAIQTLK